MSNLVGSSIGGYMVLGRVGSGSMATVYRGLHSRLGRLVALKVLHSDRQDAAFTWRLLSEARLQASLRHPGIAALYDFLEHDGQGCIVMEFVEGPTLAEYLRTHAPLPAPQALRVLQRLTDAVRYLHAQGVVHRDLKPANIKLCPDGNVKLLDFGIAYAIRESLVPGANRLIEGTYEYTAPECLRGGPANERSDIWSIGVLFYEMVTGRLPFRGHSILELLQDIDKGLAWPKLARSDRDLLARCLQKDENERLKTIADLQREIEKHLGAKGWFSSLVPRFHWTRQRPIQTAVIFGASIVLIVIWNIAGHPSARASSGEQKSILVDTVNGSAEVFRNGYDLGATPLRIREHSGQHVSLLLKRDGFIDLPVEFDVGERANYSYVLKEELH